MSDIQSQIIRKLTDVVQQSPMSAGTLRLRVPELDDMLIAGYSVSKIAAPSDCTLTVPLGLLQKFLSGDHDPHWALMTGDITYTGEFAVARAFGSILQATT